MSNPSYDNRYHAAATPKIPYIGTGVSNHLGPTPDGIAHAAQRAPGGEFGRIKRRGRSPTHRRESFDRASAQVLDSANHAFMTKREVQEKIAAIANGKTRNPTAPPPKPIQVERRETMAMNEGGFVANNKYFGTLRTATVYSSQGVLGANDDSYAYCIMNASYNGNEIMRNAIFGGSPVADKSGVNWMDAMDVLAERYGGRQKIPKYLLDFV